MKKYLLLFAVMLASFGGLLAQRTITGKVTDSSDGSALPGVNILVRGTNTGTVTDINGSYSISVSGDNPVLIFSFIGYAQEEVQVGQRSVIDVALETDITQLSEVVVIGYGQTTVKDATGAVAAVTSEDFNGGIISSPEQLIQGKTSGVQITTTSGSPGSGVQLRIRGTSSIRSNNNPLFVVDGVPLSGGTQPSSADVGFGTQQDTNPLNFINPSDIESISILKDASATSIYGSRGANGVVIITTKSGKGNRGTFDFGSSVSIAKPANEYDLLGREQFLAGVEQFGGDPVVQDHGSDTDWQDYITRTSVSHKQNLSYAKGFQTASVRASLGYEDQQGVMENSFMKRLTGRINASKSLFNDKLNIDLSTTYSNVKREDPPISGNAGFAGDILGAAYSANPTWPTDPDYNTGGQRSPANMLEYYRSTGTTNRFLTNLSADYKLTDALTAKATYGIDYSKGERYTLISGNARNAGDGVQDFGQGQLNENRTISNLLEMTLNYTKQVGMVKVEVVGGYSVQSFRNDYFWASARGFTDYTSFSAMENELRDSYEAADDAASALYEDYNNWGVTNDLRDAAQTTGGFVSGINLGEGTLQQSYFNRPAGVTVDAIAANFYDQTDYIQSYFGRGNFSISDKYLITATLRIDGSSKFGKDNRYGIFPSGAVAWKLHEENFMPDFFNTFKLRVGYGIVGNQDGLGYGEFIRRERYADVSVGSARQIGLPGTTTQGSVNPELKWETTSQTSIGIDFGILDEKVSGSLDYYVKNTTDLLLRRNAAQPAVATQIFDNLDATVQNKGWELGLTYLAVDRSEASFSISGNVSHNKNEVQDFAGVLDAGTIYGQGLTGAYAQRLAGGYPLFSYHLREFEGFDDNGQPIGDNQTFVGKSALPTWNVGFSLNARYEAFDLAMYFSGQYGHYIYNNTKNAFFTAGSINNARNVTPDVLTSGESGTAEAAVSTRFLEKGDFLRMQNFNLGYNVPMKEAGFIKNLRLYFNAQNLFVITDYTGLDPEVSTSPADDGLLNGLPTAGIDYAAYPRPRTFTIGLNASF
ncbi:TonB-dependent outer membrane receptor [Fulvivirga imtechensis AK7]|uniref:TonB-dependent outer membrane receptor n=1 Tax=Fulvivirga imtechensis AK7 TaxID=1237149 RepID=L8JV82_9BACT|nr:SusC/RagA family TonB-linked outer membrane protein [Fulvivirga imtechensis]ELR71504.1 TonB-dependent outer membrane receptor [Fulvivirga imtechensis AK7]